MAKLQHRMRTLDFSKVCRVCLNERDSLREIFSSKLPRLMESCASIKVSENEDLPRQVCVSCFHQIARFYTFKKKMERSDRILRNYLKQNKQKDILDIAISEAQIEQLTNDETGSGNEEDNILEAEKKSTRLSRKSKVKANKIIDNILKDESSEDNSNIRLVGEPPPLVPLEFKEGQEESDVNPLFKGLSKEPPPLVPLNTLLIADNSLIENPIQMKYLNLECNSCNQHFTSLSALKVHRLSSCNEKSLKCNICRKEFKERKRLIGHLKGHMVVKDYGCKICGKRYPNPSTFQVHMRTHTGERPFKCQICSKGFVRWAGVVGHMRTHQSHKPYKCDTCGKGFKISSNLERHKVLHSDSLPFCCNHCGKTFSQSDNLQLHIRTYHTNERPFLCNECGKGFVSSTRLKRHMWVHTGYKPYLCQTCPKAYSNSNDLKNHERYHLGNVGEDKRYACKVCDMRFYHACRLSKHMKTHDKPFACSMCVKNFSTNAMLNRHMSSHLPKKVRNIEFVEVEGGQSDNNVEQIFLDY